MPKYMFRQTKPVKYHLLSMLFCLSCLFIFGQVSFFIIHYQVSGLVDSLVNSAIAPVLLKPVIFLPLLFFFLIQLAAYIIVIFWVRFVAQAVGELCHCSASQVYGLGLLLWVFAIAEILLLNQYFFPHSFFASFFSVSTTFLRLSLYLWLALAILAFWSVFQHRKQAVAAYGFGLLALILYIPSLIPMPHSAARTVERERPNIILIGLDSMRPDHTGYFAQAKMHTPHIDAFLQKATTFTQAYTPLARTFPAWASILSGQYPKTNHVRNNLANPEGLLVGEWLAKKLQQAGYETWYATDEKRFSNITEAFGFDHILGPRMGVNDFLLGGLADFPLTNLMLKLPLGRFLFPYNYANRAASITYEPEQFLQLVRRGLAQHANKPQFIAIHLCISHWPFDWARSPTPALSLPSQYQQALQAVDQQFAALWQLLNEEKLLDNSWVVLLSDHGTALGLPGDTVLRKEKYLGEDQHIKLFPVTRLSSASPDSLDFDHDYTINTAYGQGTQVASLKQYQVILAFKRFGAAALSSALSRPAQVQARVALIDIAPTLLDLLHLPALPHADGISLRPYLFREAARDSNKLRPLFLETGDSLSEIATDQIDVLQVVRRKLNVYGLNPKNGHLFIAKAAEKSIIENKQLAVLAGDWLLARYPKHWQQKLVFSPQAPQAQDALAANAKLLTLGLQVVPVNYLLANIRTGQWSIGLESDFAKSAPTVWLLQQLKQHYGDEV